MLVFQFFLSAYIWHHWQKKWNNTSTIADHYKNVINVFWLGKQKRTSKVYKDHKSSAL